MNDPNSVDTSKRAYQLQDIEKASAVNGGDQGNSPSSLANTTNAIRTVSDLFASVKMGDSSFKPKPASKVVNPDGTPKEVYHGTVYDFTIFDGGAFFTDDYFNADGYASGEIVLETFLKIERPLIIDAQGHKWNELTTPYGSSTQQIIHNTDRSKYDGVIFENINDSWTDDAEFGDAETVYYPFKNSQIKSATDNVGTFDGSNPDIRYSDRDSAKTRTFKNGQNAKGEFIANVLIDLADSNSEWWTGRYNRGILGMSKNDDTEFRQFYQEILKRTKEMDEYGESDLTVEDSFKVQDGKGKEYVYVVKLDGYLHGVVLGKIDAAKHERAMKRYERSKEYGRADADISRRAANARNEVERHSPRNSRNLTSDGDSGYGRVDSGSPQGDLAGNDEGESPPNGKVPAVTDSDGALFQDRTDDSVSNRSLLANALEVVAKTDLEKQKLQEYKDRIALLDEQEKKLRDLNAQIKELSFAKGPRDAKKISALRDEATMTANRISTLDKILLRLEAAKPLQDVLAREKKRAYDKAAQRGREALAEYKADAEAKQKETAEKWRESRKKAVAKARETAEKRDAREKLQKLVLDTVKWITYPAKTDVKCPDILKQPYADFLNGIDLSSKRLANGGDPTKNDLRLSSAMDSLATALDRIMTAQDPAQETDKVLDTSYLDLPANFVKQLRDMNEDIKSMMVDGDYVVNTMTASEVRKLSQMIRTLNHAIKTMKGVNIIGV